jgi:BlaI family penicillinase repressor
MATSRFGRQQFRIMLVLWEKGRATAREITEALNLHEPITHSTVQTLLRQLEKKGAITHDVDERTFIFRPLKNQEKARDNATHEVIDSLFHDSPGELISHLLEHEQITPEEREEIRAIVEELAKKSEKKRRTGNTNE